MNSRQLTWSRSVRCVRHALMNPPGSSWLQSSRSLGRWPTSYAASPLVFSSTSCSQPSSIFSSNNILLQHEELSIGCCATKENGEKVTNRKQIARQHSCRKKTDLGISVVDQIKICLASGFDLVVVSNTVHVCTCSRFHFHLGTLGAPLWMAWLTS